MVRGRCSWCGARMDTPARAQRGGRRKFFCSSRCRSAHHRCPVGQLYERAAHPRGWYSDPVKQAAWRGRMLADDLAQDEAEQRASAPEIRAS